VGASQLGANGVSSQLARPPTSNEYGEEWLARRPTGFRYAWGGTHRNIGGSASSLTQLQASEALAAGLTRLRLHPNVFPNAGILDKITFYVRSPVAGTGSKIRLAIYDSTNLAGIGTYPGNRVWQSGEINIGSGSTGVFNEVLVSLFPNLAIQKNSVYWLGWIYNSAFRLDNNGGNISVFAFQNHAAHGFNGFIDTTSVSLYADGSVINVTDSNSMAMVYVNGQGSENVGWGCKIPTMVFGDGHPTIFPTGQTLNAADTVGAFPIGGTEMVDRYVGNVNRDGLEQRVLGVFYKVS